MANTTIQLKRSSVAGKQPNTSTLSIGELALNLTDRKLYSSDGTNIFETGANLSSLSVSNTILIGNSSVNTIINATSVFSSSVSAVNNFITQYLYGSAIGGFVANATTIGIGNSSVNATINSTSFTGTSYSANNSSYLGGVAAASYVNTSGSYTIGGVLTHSANVVLNNNVDLNFKTLSGANVSFVQQNDDNFVMYSTNTAGGQRAIWAVFANSITSNFNTVVPLQPTGGISANGSLGTAGQVLSSNGSATYWSTPGAASVNTAAAWTWTNVHTFSANVIFNGLIGVNNSNSIYFNAITDANWRIGRNTGATTKFYYTNNSLDIIGANSNLEGIAFGFTGNSYLETGYAGTFTRNPIYVGNATVNLAINSTAIVGNTITVGSPNTAVFYNYNGQVNATAGAFLSNAYAAFGGFGGNYLAVGQQSNFHQWIQSGFSSAVSPAYYSIILNPLGGNVGIGNTTPTDRLSIGGTSYHGGNVIISTTSGLSANGGYGTSGQVLTSNGSAVYWSTVAGVNTAAQYTWSNTQTFQNTITFSSNIIASANIYANTGLVVANTIATSMAAAATANGTTQVTAYPITTTSVQFSTVASGTGAVLPSVAPGVRIFIANDGGNPLLVYPPSGGIIDQTSLNTPVTISAGGMWEGQALTTLNWTSISPDTQANNGVVVTQSNGAVVLSVNSAYIGTLTANNANNLGGVAAASYQLNSTLSANVATLTANNTSYVGSVTAANVVSNAQLSANLANYATLAGATFTGAVTISNNLTVSGNLTLSGNTVIVGANNLIVQDAVMSLHTYANLAPWAANDGKNVGIALHYYDTADRQGLLALNPANSFLTYYNTSSDAALGDPVGNTLGTIQGIAFYAGNSSVYATVNATTYSGTANNATNFGGSSYATVTGYITANAATAYTNATATAATDASTKAATAYTNATSYAATAAASAYSNAVAAASTDASTKAGTAYTNATSYVTGTAYTRTAVTTLNANLVIGTTAAISANGGVGTAGQVLTSNGSTVYWSTVAAGGGSVNTAAAYTWTNTHTFSNTSAIVLSGGAGTNSSGIYFANSGGQKLYWDGYEVAINGSLYLNGATQALWAQNIAYFRGGIKNDTADPLYIYGGTSNNTQISGNLNVTGDVTTNYSDIRLKDVSGPVTNALEKVNSLTGFYYTPNDLAIELGVESTKLNRVGISAQDLQLVLPEAVKDAPGANGYLTVQYERIVPLLIEAIKELKLEIEEI